MGNKIKMMNTIHCYSYRVTALQRTKWIVVISESICAINTAIFYKIQVEISETYNKMLERKIFRDCSRIAPVRWWLVLNNDLFRVDVPAACLSLGAVIYCRFQVSKVSFTISLFIFHAFRVHYTRFNVVYHHERLDAARSRQLYSSRKHHYSFRYGNGALSLNTCCLYLWEFRQRYKLLKHLKWHPLLIFQRCGRFGLRGLLP